MEFKFYTELVLLSFYLMLKSVAIETITKGVADQISVIRDNFIERGAQDHRRKLQNL